MDFFDLVAKRKSVRRFSDRDVDAAALERLMDAVRRSPSWANTQCWRFVVVRDAARRARISELSYDEAFFAAKGYKANPSKKGLAEAPVVIVACADPKDSGQVRGQDYYLADIGIASEALMLGAAALGLGTVYVGIYDERGVKELLSIPEHVRVAGIFPVGYPLEDKPGSTTRKPLSEITFNERWGG